MRELSGSRSSYSQIARDLGINRQQFARFLNGTSLPRDALVRKIAEYFDVELSELFQESDPKPQEPENLPSDRTFSLLQTCLSQLGREPVSELELASGFYMSYKWSFTQPGKIICMLSRVYRDRNGMTHCKKRYSVKLTKDLPGVRVDQTSYGVFCKNLNAMMLFEGDGVAGDLVVSAFTPVANYLVADQLKIGVSLTHGRPGNQGPLAVHQIIEKIPMSDSLLDWARRQELFHLSDMPDHIQSIFSSLDRQQMGRLSAQ